MHKQPLLNMNKLTKLLYTSLTMDRGNHIVRCALIATISLATSCAKPDLNSITTDITKSIDDMSATISTSIKGGFSTQEAKNCLREAINIKELELPTKAVVSIEVNPKFFALYTKSKSWSDWKGANYYFVDLVNRQITLFETSSKMWVEKERIDLPPDNYEQYLYIPDNTRKKQTLEINNPFLAPRERLTIRQGIGGINIFGGTSTFDRLTEGEVHAIVCAGALNSFFEKFMKTKYEFKE